MKAIPELTLPDNSVPFLLNGYPFLLEKFKEKNTRILKTRLAMNSVVCLRGEEGAKLFYDNSKFLRKGVVPKRVQKTLFGEGGIQGLDDEEHQHRKAMFMKYMNPSSMDRLINILDEEWKSRINTWEGKEVNLLNASINIIFKSIYEWAGIPVGEDELEEKAADAFEMIDAFGGILERHQKGVSARKRHEEWLMEVIQEIRDGKRQVSADKAGHIIAMHKDLNGELLDLHTAAVDLSNGTRPAIALAVFVTFGALSLYNDPSLIDALQNKGDDYLECFSQEVRRYYPFVPLLGARARRDFTWNDYQFDEDQLVLLDVYGILHDPEIWDEPFAFKPDRFYDWDHSAYNFIPQGGGDFDVGHRCAGEWISIKILNSTFHALTNYMKYDVPKQDLSFSLKRFPTYPSSGFIINNVESKL